MTSCRVNPDYPELDNEEDLKSYRMIPILGTGLPVIKQIERLLNDDNPTADLSSLRPAAPSVGGAAEGSTRKAEGVSQADSKAKRSEASKVVTKKKATKKTPSKA